MGNVRHLTTVNNLSVTPNPPAHSLSLFKGGGRRGDSIYILDPTFQSLNHPLTTCIGLFSGGPSCSDIYLVPVLCCCVCHLFLPPRLFLWKIQLHHSIVPIIMKRPFSRSFFREIWKKKRTRPADDRSQATE